MNSLVVGLLLVSGVIDMVALDWPIMIRCYVKVLLRVMLGGVVLLRKFVELLGWFCC